MVPDGAGPPEARPVVVLLHAGVADSRMWDVQRHALEGRYAVLAPDLRGFGGRPHTPGEFSHTDDVLELLDRNGVDRAALVGASFGGRVALETASVAPARVSALVGLRQPAIDLAALSMPTLVVSGAHDLLWFRQTADHLAQPQPDAEALELGWAGHLPSLEGPDEAAGLVAAFLDRRLRPVR